MSIFTQRQKSEPKPADSNVIMRFLTLGGATVELRTYQFTTRWHPLKGRPNVVVKPYEVGGFAWECDGCDAVDCGQGIGYGERGYLPREQRTARNDANEHASTCRAMPKPEASR